MLEDTKFVYLILNSCSRKMIFLPYFPNELKVCNDA